MWNFLAAKDLPADPERFLKKRFGCGVLAHCFVQHCQVVEALGGVGMIQPKDLLPDPERFLKERFGFVVLTHSLVQLTQVIEGSRRSGCSAPKTFRWIRSPSW